MEDLRQTNFGPNDMYNIDEAAQINFGVQKIKNMIRII